MSFGLIRAVVAEISQMLQDWQEAYDLEFSPSFNVTGGEPFLRPDFLAILEEMVGAGFDCYVLSNGTIITPERAQALAGLGVKGVQVSLEGPEEIHDEIRGRGSFAASLKGIQNLLDAGVQVSVNATLSRLNAGAMSWTWCDLPPPWGSPGSAAPGWCPGARARPCWPQMLEPQEVKALYEELFSLNVKGLEIVSGDPMAAQMLVAGRW